MPRVFTPSSNVAQLQESATIAVSSKARSLKAAGRAIIDLGVGEPDGDTPEYIRRAAQRAIDAGATRYTATEGILALREVIAARANERYRGSDAVDPRDVVVSAGAKQALFNACFALFGDGAEVLVPTPAWTSYYEMLALSRAVAIPVRGDPSRALKVTADSLEQAATEKTRGLILNSPCNPTGAVYSRAELAEIVALAADRGWWLISDEIYLRIVYDTPAASALDVAERRDRLVIVDGVSKTFAMTGWRLGWSVAPRTLSQSLVSLQSHTTSNPAAVSQHAALAALSDRTRGDRAVRDQVASLRARRDDAVHTLDSAGVDYVDPDGAFYLYLNVAGDAPRLADPGTAFARHLLEQHDVAVVPGCAFLTPGWVRVSYAAPAADVAEGMRRIVAACREWPSVAASLSHGGSHP